LRFIEGIDPNDGKVWDGDTLLRALRDRPGAEAALWSRVRSPADLDRVTATLAEAKAALEQGRAREDVFITRSGGRDEPVVGWITDNDLVRLSRA
jgi:hypothetical protein